MRECFEEAAVDKAHVKGVSGNKVIDAEGKTISPQRMLADRQIDLAKEGHIREIQSGVRLPARSAKNEPPSRF